MRSLNAQVQAAAVAEVVRLIWMVKLDFPSGVVAACSAPFDVAYGGDTYLGVAHLGSVEPAEEGAELQAYQLRIGLSGVQPEHLATVLGQHAINRPALVMIAFLDVEHAIIGEPVIIFRGRMDVADIELGETASITVPVTSRLVDWERARVRRYTAEDQKAAFPGDLGLDFVPAMADTEIKWGRA